MTNYEESFFDDPWEYITGPNYPAVNLLFREDNRFYISINEMNQKLFVIQVPFNIIADIPSGLKSVEVEIVKFDDNKTRLLCILTDEDLIDNFTLVIKHVAYQCAQYPDETVISKAIQKLFSWAELLKPSGKGISKSVQMGFWGEMFVLDQYVSKVHPIKDAISFWIGPEQKKQDFTLNHMALEVKTTMSGSGSTIKISSLEQLDKITDHLYLIHVFINKGNAPDSLSLKDLYDQIIESINDDTETKANFLFSASKIYGKATDAQRNEKFTFLDYNLYEIDENFPIISSNELPDAIRSVRYEIETSKISSFKIEMPMEDVIKNE